MYDPKTIGEVQKILGRYEDASQREKAKWHKTKPGLFYPHGDGKGMLQAQYLELIHSEVNKQFKNVRSDISKIGPMVDKGVSADAAELAQIRDYFEKNLPELMKTAGKKARIADVVVAVLESRTK